MAEPVNLPPDLQRIADQVDAEPPHDREAVHYLLALMMMVDDERAKITQMRTHEGRTFLKIEAVTGERFEIVRPEISAEQEAELREQLWEILQEDQQGG